MKWFWIGAGIIFCNFLSIEMLGCNLFEFFKGFITSEGFEGCVIVCAAAYVIPRWIKEAVKESIEKSNSQTPPREPLS